MKILDEPSTGVLNKDTPERREYCRKLLLRHNWSYDYKKPCCWKKGRFRLCLNNVVLLPDGDIEYSAKKPGFVWPKALC